MATVDSTVKLLEAAGKSAEKATMQIEAMTKATDKLAKAMTKASKISVVTSKALNSQQRMIKNFEKIVKTIQKAASEQKKFNQQVSSGRTSLKGLTTPLNRLVSLSNSLKSNMRDAGKSAKFFQNADKQVQKLTRTIKQLMSTINQTLKVLQRMIRNFDTLIRKTNSFLNNIRKVLSALRQVRDVLNRIRNLMQRASLHMRQFNSQAQAGRRSLNGLAPPLRNLVALSNTLKSNMRQVNKYVQPVQKASGNTSGQQASQKANAGQKVFNSLLSTMKRGVSNLFSVQSIKSAMAFSDNYMNSLARIRAVNDGTQSDKELQAKIFTAADRSLGRYMDMTEHVAKLGLMAPQAFSGNDEMIAFAELSQKAFRLGGTSAAEQQAGMAQLVQSIAAGGLQGNDLLSIMETAPMLADALSSFTGKSIEELIALSAEGLITSDILIGAMFFAADEINRKFGELPNSFGELWNDISNSAIESFGPVIERVSQLVNSAEGRQVIDRISQAIQMAATMVGELVAGIGMVATFISSNWSVIEPIIWGIAAAFGAWMLVTHQQAIIQGMLAIRTAIMTAAIIGQTVATQGLTAAWRMLTEAQKANIFILLISVIVALVMWLVNLWKTNDEFAAWLMRAWNGILNFFDSIPGYFWQFVEWWTHPFEWWASSIGKYVENVINGFIDGINQVLDFINSITGSDFQIDFKFDFEKMAQDLREEARIRKDDAFARAAEKAAERERKVQEFLDNRAAKRAREEAEKEAKEEDYSKWQKEQPEWPTNQPDINKVNEVGRINDTVDISSEDLKMMRELAEMNAIQNFVSLTPTVNVQTGDIRNGYDVDTIISRIEQSLTEQIASSAQGVYGLG